MKFLQHRQGFPPPVRMFPCLLNAAQQQQALAAFMKSESAVDQTQH